VVHAIRPRNVSAALFQETLAGFLLLMIIELRFAAEPGAALLGGRTASVGAL
jgi:hypothetical protein